MASAPLTEGAWPQKEKERHKNLVWGCFGAYQFSTIATTIRAHKRAIESRYEVVVETANSANKLRHIALAVMIMG